MATKKTRRQRTEYPNLKHETNLRSRKEYIETDYIDGVYNSEGKQVIRAMTPDEKQWLDQFYKEYTIASLPTNVIIKKKLKDIKKIKKQLRTCEPIEIEEIEEQYIKLINEFEVLREKAGAMFPSYEDHLNIFNSNNARNRCLFNKAKTTGNLVNLDISEYDQFTSKAIENSGLDCEHIIIDKCPKKDDYDEN